MLIILSTLENDPLWGEDPLEIFDAYEENDGKNYSTVGNSAEDSLNIELSDEVNLASHEDLNPAIPDRPAELENTALLAKNFPIEDVEITGDQSVAPELITPRLTNVSGMASTEIREPLILISSTDEPENQVEQPIDIEFTTPIVATPSDGIVKADLDPISLGDDDRNRPPTDILLSNYTIDENSPPGTEVGILTTLDPDSSDTHTYILVDDAQGQFILSGDRIVIGTPVNLELSNNSEILVRSTDSNGRFIETTLAITLSNTDDAPVIDPPETRKLLPITSNLPVSRNQGTRVSQILASTNPNPITDPDPGAVQGIAITALDSSNGTWEYSLDDGNAWIAFTAVSDRAATLLTPEVRLRFLPNANYNGSAGISFRAWDGSDGNLRGTTGVDTSINRSDSAFSQETTAAELSVIPPIYFLDLGLPVPGDEGIRQLELGGAGLVDRVMGSGNLLALAVHLPHNQLYWTDDTFNQIQRANLEGSGIETLITGVNQPRAIAIDSVNDFLYWVDAASDTLERSQLDGTERTVLVNLTGRINPFPTGLALDLTGNKIYWAEDGNNKIQRANLDGTEIEDIITTDLARPRAIAIDRDRSKLYWSDLQTQRIERSNLDGSGREVVISDIPFVTGLALSPHEGKLYWVDDFSDRLQRANLDGTSVETLYTGTNLTLTGLALAI